MTTVGGPPPGAFTFVTPVAAGEQTYKVTVGVVFQLADPTPASPPRDKR